MNCPKCGAKKLFTSTRWHEFACGSSWDVETQLDFRRHDRCKLNRLRSMLSLIPDMLPDGYEALSREIEAVLGECE